MRFWGVVIFVAVLGICLGCEDSSSSNDLNEASVDMSRTLTGDARVIEPESDAILISDGGDVESNDAGDLACVPNEGALCIDDMTRRVCNAQGTDYVDETCAEGERCVAGSCAPSTCRVGEHICLDERTIGGCRRDESGYIPIRTCDEDSPCVDGRCNSGCNPLGKIPSNIGCEYWSVDLDNYPDPFSNDPSSVPHAIVISNTSEAPASVTVEGPGGVTLVDPEFVVADGDVHVFTFPRLDIDGTGIFDRAFKISSTQPVIVYQFNPLNNEGVASNDASLLLPKEGLGREYVALSWAIWCSNLSGHEPGQLFTPSKWLRDRRCHERRLDYRESHANCSSRSWRYLGGHAGRYGARNRLDPGSGAQPSSAGRRPRRYFFSMHVE